MQIKAVDNVIQQKQNQAFQLYIDELRKLDQENSFVGQVLND